MSDPIEINLEITRLLTELQAARQTLQEASAIAQKWARFGAETGIEHLTKEEADQLFDGLCTIVDKLAQFRW